MPNKRNWSTAKTFSFLKVSEGGPGQRAILADLKAAGIDATPFVSPYVGQTAVMVFGGMRAEKKASRLIYGTR